MANCDTVQAALAAGREAVARALAIGATTGPEPDEETLSWILESTVAWRTDRITVRRFTRQEESHYTGADWLWWWEGAPDEWFGCLVQAKRLTPSANGPTFDFDYVPAPSAATPDPVRQIDRLLEASDVLNVPAAYMLYRSPVLGFPAWWACPTLEPGFGTAAATFVAAAVVDRLKNMPRDAVLSAARPAECLACDGLCGVDAAALIWYARGMADPDVRHILRAPPTTSARKAFRALFSGFAQLRYGQFAAVLDDAPDARRSGSRPDEQFIRGVREPPAYVNTILNDGDDREFADEPGLDRVSGVVIVRD